MAKYRHRAFEMFDFLDEATRALSSKSARVATASIDPALWTFHRIATSRESTVVHVTFKATDNSSDSAIAELGDDLSKLADSLPNDSQVVVDFEGLNEFCAERIELLALFNRKIQSKGSRIALCNLEPEVREVFFPIRK